MSDDKHLEIRSERQIQKFCIYGFLKNLKFFEPYLLIFLMGKGISLFEIGLLIGIREILINVFEIPSGFIADYFGRKKELYFCFSLYILSFVCFFFTNSFAMAAVAMGLFGLGEAFRSGTHKAMIFTYLDHRGWQGEKTYVYGLTRSWSLVGSAVSSVIGILLILLAPAVNFIFLFSIIPYILDFFLILSYPAYLDQSDKEGETDLRGMFRSVYLQFRHSRLLRNLLMEEGIFESIISYTKDMIQPILETIILSSGFVVLSRLSKEDNLHVLLGLTYAALNLFGSYASHQSHVIKKHGTSLHCLWTLHLGLAISMAVLALISRFSLPVLAVYLVIYFLFNVRKPIFIDELDEHIEKSARATTLSISAQLKSLLLVILAPVSGWIADRFGIAAMMLLLSLCLLASLPLLRVRKSSKAEA